MRQKVRSRIKVRYGLQQDVRVWEWLIDNISIDRLHLEITETADADWMREIQVVFASELDGRKFANWAIQRGYRVVEADTMTD